MTNNNVLNHLNYRSKTSDPTLRRLYESIDCARVFNTRYLIDNASIDLSGIYGRVALSIACHISDEKSKIRTAILDWLLQVGCDINLKDEHGLTLISWLCKEGKIDVVKFVMRNRKMDIRYDITDNNNDSVLIHAVRTGDLELVKIILDVIIQFGINIVDMRNKTGLTPYSEAKRLKLNEIVKLLVDVGNASHCVIIEPIVDINHSFQKTLEEANALKKEKRIIRIQNVRRKSVTHLTPPKRTLNLIMIEPNKVMREKYGKEEIPIHSKSQDVKTDHTVVVDSVDIEQRVRPASTVIIRSQISTEVTNNSDKKQRKVSTGRKRRSRNSSRRNSNSTYNSTKMREISNSLAALSTSAETDDVVERSKNVNNLISTEPVKTQKTEESTERTEDTFEEFTEHPDIKIHSGNKSPASVLWRRTSEKAILQQAKPRGLLRANSKSQRRITSRPNSALSNFEFVDNKDPLYYQTKIDDLMQYKMKPPPQCTENITYSDLKGMYGKHLSSNKSSSYSNVGWLLQMKEEQQKDTFLKTVYRQLEQNVAVSGKNGRIGSTISILTDSGLGIPRISSKKQSALVNAAMNRIISAT